MGYSKIQTNSISIKPSIQNSISLKNVNLISNGNDIFSYPLSNNDELSFIKFNGQLPYNSIVPHKHGEYSLSGSVFASGFANNDVAPYKAFTYNTTDKWQVDTITGIIGYEFTEPKLIYKYEISCHSLTNINMAPKTWTFEGYNEDTFFWDVLDTQTDIVLTATDFTRTIFITNPTTKYKKYRLNITVNNGNATSLSINHLKLYEVYDKLDMDNKVRIELDNRTKLYLYKITDGMCNIYQQNSAYEITIPKINSEYYIYFHLNGSGSLVFEAEQIKTIRQNRTDVFPICSVYNNSENKIVSCNKVNKIVYSTIFNVQRVKTPMPTSRGLRSNSSKKDNVMYVIGGDSIANEGYNVFDDSWTAYTHHSVRHPYASCATVYITFYQFGGNANSPNREFFTYNIDLNSWTTQTNMPVARTQHCSDQYNNSKIYLITTYSSAQETPTGEYTIFDGSWVSKSNIPDRHRLATATTYNDSIYCIGGTSLVDATTTNREYSITNDIWSVKQSMLIENLYSQSANLINNYILCLGDYNLNNSYYNHSYFPLEDTWLNNGNMYTRLHGPTSQYINGNIYSASTERICTEYIPPSY
jgi:hypothetical protein